MATQKVDQFLQKADFYVGDAHDIIGGTPNSNAGASAKFSLPNLIYDYIGGQSSMDDHEMQQDRSW